MLLIVLRAPLNMVGLSPHWVLAWISTLHGTRNCVWWLVGIVGGICVWCRREVVSRLVPQLIKNEWRERRGGALSCCLSSLTLTSLVAALLLPLGNTVYTILNPTAAQRCQVLCNTVLQLSESHTIETRMKILISETTQVYSWEFSGGWCLLKRWRIGLIRMQEKALNRQKYRAFSKTSHEKARTSSSHHPLEPALFWMIKYTFWPQT